MTRSLLLLEGLSYWQGLQDVVPVYSFFWNECSYFFELPSFSDEGFEQLRVGMLLILRMYRRRAFSFLPFVLDFLEGVLTLGFFFLSSSNCESICLRLSIDSCWPQIISSCSLWAWACWSKRLAGTLVYWVYHTSSSACMLVYSFRLGVRLELTIGCFLVLLGVVLRSTMFAVISGYSTSEKVLLVGPKAFHSSFDDD